VCLTLGQSFSQGATGEPKVLEMALAVSCSLGNQLSSSRSAGADIDKPAKSLPWSS
jgi:hypothetical protein